MKKNAIYPGTFDPITYGHIDVIRRSLKIVDKLIVAVSNDYLKDYLKKTGQKGTIRLYGTPAEEGGSGKVYMVRAGLFDDVDVVLHWHAGDRNTASTSTSMANRSAKFRFHGYSAHAAGAPEKGRSSLDAVEAMNHMVNLMREHIPDDSRIHYVITRGGNAPNVVPDFAEVFYLSLIHI